MTWIWIVQLALDVALILTVMALWKPERQSSSEDSASEGRITASLNVLETRALQLEKDIQGYRKTIDEQLTTLLAICDQARQILDKGQARVTNFLPSLEEDELRVTPTEIIPAPVEPSITALKIPTLQELEAVRLRHRSDITLDLKTILKDQLA